MRVFVDENGKVHLAPHHSIDVVSEVQKAVDAIMAGDFDEVDIAEDDAIKPARLAAAIHEDVDAKHSQPGSAGHGSFKPAAWSSSLLASSTTDQ